MTELKKRPTDDQSAQPQKRVVKPFKLYLDGLKPFRDAWFIYEPIFVEHELGFKIMAEILRKHVFNQNKVVVFGRECVAPRMEAMLGRTAGVQYMYAKNKLITEEWSSDVEQLCQQMSAKYKVQFNACLANYYRTGKDHVGRHADDENDMESDIIATVSLGAPRFLRVFDKETGEKQIQLIMRHGSVHVQLTGMQKIRKHEVPEQATVKGARLSLTFRKLKLPK